MIKATPEQQRRLLDLQQIDTAIHLLDHRRANLPEQKVLDHNADTLTRVAGEYATAKEESETLERRQKRLEDDVSQVDSRRRSEEGRMYSGLITSEREVEALRNELSSLKARKAQLEDELLEIMERRDDLDGLLATLKERHGQLTSEVATLTEARDEAAIDIDAQLERNGAERDSVVADLPPDVLAYYDELRGRKDGVAVAELSGRTCQGCRLELTATELEETRADAKRGLARCAQCGRVLVPSRSG